MEKVSPSFKKPPIVEVAVSVSFQKIDRFSAVHFGLLWSTMRDQFPEFRPMPELADVIETFDGPVAAANKLEFVDVPDLRGWYISGDDTEVVQIQGDRFIYNWRRGSGGAEYPRYESHVRKRFLSEWHRFQQFLASESMAVPAVHQCEITYINQIPYGCGWTSVEDLGKVFQSIGHLRKDSFLQSAETARISFSFVIPGQMCRIRPTITLGVASDKSLVLNFAIAAKGTPRGATESEIMAWMDMAKTCVVHAFSDLTTVEMHEIWERIE